MFKIIASDGKEYGPVAADILRKWLAEGRLNRQTKVQAEGAAEWRPLGQVPGFLEPQEVPGESPVIGTSASTGGRVVNVIIPYKNVRALVAYYLAVFSLIPFIGIPLGLGGFVLGILGLRFRSRHPEAGGVVHAWIGIILGGLCGFGYLALVVVGIIAANQHH